MSKKIFTNTFTLIKDGCYPGGYEGQLVGINENTKESESDSDIEENHCRWKVFNALVSPRDVGVQ